jgi:hypothetical protein
MFLCFLLPWWPIRSGALLDQACWKRCWRLPHPGRQRAHLPPGDGFGDPEETRHSEALAIVAQAEEILGSVLRRDGRIGDNDATALAHIMSAVMFLSMAVSLTVEQIVQDIRRQVGVLLPL